MGTIFLVNERPQYWSTLKGIWLLWEYSDVCMDQFLRPFIDDLKILYCDGISVHAWCGLLAVLADMSFSLIFVVHA